MRVAIYTSDRSTSLSNVAQSIYNYLLTRGLDKGIEPVELIKGPYGDTVRMRNHDAAIIVMTFNLVWGGPFFFTCRNYLSNGKPCIFYTTLEGPVKRTFGDEWIFKYLDFVANSQYTKEKIESAGGSVVDVIYHGVDVDSIAEAKRLGVLKRGELGIDVSDAVLLYVAAGYPRKGHYIFSRAVDLFHEINPEAKVVILTDQAGAKHYTPRKNLIVLDQFGQLPYEEVIAYFHMADVYVQASLGEGFGLPVLEALASGKLVVHPDYRPLSEITDEETSVRVPVKRTEIVDGGDGMFYEYHYYDPQEMANAMSVAIDLLSEKKEEIARKAYERAKLFDLDNVYSKFIPLLKVVR